MLTGLVLSRHRQILLLLEESSPSPFHGFRVLHASSSVLVVSGSLHIVDYVESCIKYTVSVHCIITAAPNSQRSISLFAFHSFIELFFYQVFFPFPSHLWKSYCSVFIMLPTAFICSFCTVCEYWFLSTTIHSDTHSRLCCFSLSRCHSLQFSHFPLLPPCSSPFCSVGLFHILLCLTITSFLSFSNPQSSIAVLSLISIIHSALWHTAECARQLHEICVHRFPSVVFKDIAKPPDVPYPTSDNCQGMTMIRMERNHHDSKGSVHASFVQCDIALLLFGIKCIYGHQFGIL